jgi:signal peptidase I
MTVNPSQSDARSLVQSSLEKGAIVRLRINGESMRPWLRKGDMVLLRRESVSKLVPGDILTFLQNGDLVTHRLLAVRGDRWYLKGDATYTLDEPITEEAILGRVEAIEADGSMIDIRRGLWISASRIIGWLAWNEARAYQIYQKVSKDQDNRLKWMARLFMIPFRLPIWLLSALRR